MCYMGQVNLCNMDIADFTYLFKRRLHDNYEITFRFTCIKFREALHTNKEDNSVAGWIVCYVANLIMTIL